MFYRRKILLSLFQLFEGDLEKIRLHKLLFLFSLKQPKPSYDFIPYKYGCYSYSANADLTKMVKQKLLLESETNFRCDSTFDYLSMLNLVDKNELLTIQKEYGEFSSNDLIRYTYLNYPFYAINSIKAKEILTNDELKTVEANRPGSDDTLLYTIGYEGVSLETYLNKLILNNIKVLVDVRNNPQSMKYGFSRGQLIKYCEGLGIKYVHFPELGISSNQRQSLKDQMDYDKLFSIYESNNLPETKSYQIEIVNLLDKHKRIALTCFEKNICQCHRKHLAESIESLYNYQHKVVHI